MPHRTACLSLTTLVKKIEQTLADCPESLSGSSCSDPEVLQSILARVLVRLPECSIAKNPGFVCFSLPEKTCVDSLIRQSIESLPDSKWSTAQALPLSIDLKPLALEAAT